MHNQKKEIDTASLITIIDRGDLFASGIQTLVNPVNCRGAMGKGLALIFKKRYPLMFQDYQNRCKQNLVKLGEPYIWKETSSLSPIWVLNFPTKGNWSNKSNLHDIRNGLQHLAQHAKEWGITSLAIPALGCGLGGLSWEAVLPEITTYLAPLQIPIQIYKEGPILAKNSRKKKKNTTNCSTSNELPSDSLERFFSRKRKRSSPSHALLSEEKEEREPTLTAPN
ncbi:MAG: macro domain-containing protein [Gammaproteobacteria bacterium]